MLPRSLGGDHAPDVAPIVRREMVAHLLPEIGSVLRVAARQAGKGEYRQLPRRLPFRLAQAFQEARGGSGCGVHPARIEGLGSRQAAESAPGRARQVRVHQDPEARPDLLRAEQAGPQGLLCERQAALGKFAGRIPVRLDAGERRGVVLSPAREQRIAADVGILALEQGQLTKEQVPALFLSEREQPVAAQRLGERRIGLAPEKCLHFLRPRLVQAHLEPPVIDPGLEQVAIQLCGIPGQFRRIARVESVSGGEKRPVLPLAARSPGKRRHQRQANGEQKFQKCYIRNIHTVLF